MTYLVMNGKQILAHYLTLEGATQYYLTVGGPTHDQMHIRSESQEAS
jgi:hypothetical protein